MQIFDKKGDQEVMLRSCWTNPVNDDFNRGKAGNHQEFPYCENIK